MWNVLIVVIIAAIIWAMNPLMHTELRPSTKLDKKTQTQVDQVQNQAIQQVNQARQIQQQEQQTVDN